MDAEAKYTMQALTRPDTYARDPRLAALARRTAHAHFERLGRGRMSLGALKEQFVAGAYPELMAQALREDAERQAARADRFARALSAARSIAWPDGFRVHISDEEIVIKGPFSPAFHACIKAAGGHWSGKHSGNRKCWIVPPKNGGFLKFHLRVWLRERREAEQWIAEVEARAPGSLHKAAVKRLRYLDLERWPDLAARLRNAAASVEEAKRARVAERAAARLRARTERDDAREREKRRRLYLDVPFPEKELAKTQGAAWDTEHKRWYVLDAIPEPLKIFALEDAHLPEGHFRIGGGEGHGWRPMHPGQVLRNPHLDPRAWNQGVKPDAALPEILTVVSATQHYYGADGERFGVGAERGHVFQAVVRAATPTEAAPLRQRDRGEHARQGAMAQADKLSRMVRETGERPSGMHSPQGQRLLDTQTLFGGGDWWLIDREAGWIWYVRLRGSEGPGWSEHNIDTHGGATGWRVPYDAELARTLLDLDRAYLPPHSPRP